MKRILLVFVLLAALVSAACDRDRGEIRVTSEVTSVVLRNIRWGERHVATRLLPGEWSSWLVISENDETFEEEHHVTFYMEKDGAKVFLRTKEKFFVGKDSETEVIIGPDTEVENLAVR